MGRKSSIDRLEPEIKAYIQAMLASGSMTLDELIADLRERWPAQSGSGELPSRSALHRYGSKLDRRLTATFDDAVANGLYERVCFMKGTPPTLEGKQAWYSKIRNGYGVRKAAMREELDAIPRDGNGVCLPGVWIEQAMVLPDSAVLRLTLDEDFVLKSPAEREAWVADWIERNLVPALARLDKNVRHVFSHDYARHRDFSIWGATALTTGMRRQVPLVIEMHKVPYAQQKQITWYAIERLPRRCGGAMDAGAAAVHPQQRRERRMDHHGLMA